MILFYPKPDSKCNCPVQDCTRTETICCTLIKYGRSELENPKQFNDLGEIHVRLVDKKSEAFFVIDLRLHSSNVYEIVQSIENYTYEFFKDLKNTRVDVNSFVLSYFVKIDGVQKSRTYFIRSKRVELKKLMSEISNSKEFVWKN